MADSNKHIRQVFDKSYNADEAYIALQERKLLALYRESLKEVQRDLSRMYEKFGEGVTLADMRKKTSVRRNGKDYRITRLEALQFQIKEQITELTKGARKVTTSTIKDVFEENYNITGYAFESGLNVKTSFQALNPAVIRASLDNPAIAVQWPARMKGHAEVLNNRISQSITKGLIQGTGFDKTARQFRKQMRDEIGDNFEKYAGQVNTIVRTESLRAQSVGRLLGMEKTAKSAERLGIKQEKAWVSVRDERTRRTPRDSADHVRMNGKVANEEGLFELIPSGTTTAPRMSGIAKQDINCRCDIITQFPDIPARFSTTDADGNKIYQNYADWGKQKDIKVGYNA